MASQDWKNAVVGTHNDLRAKHGAPPLQWCEECYAAAKRQADFCSSRNTLSHGNTDGPSGKHGQNAFWGSSGRNTPIDVVESWYKEIVKPGYNFASSTVQLGAAHFSQVVWVNSERVGMAKSADGKFSVANYFPAGNMMGDFASNVLPKGSPMKTRTGAQMTQNKSTTVASASPGPVSNPKRTPQPSVSQTPPLQSGRHVVVLLNGQRLDGTLVREVGDKCHVQLKKDRIGTITILPRSSLEPEESCISRCCSWISGSRKRRHQESQGLMVAEMAPRTLIPPSQARMAVGPGVRVQVNYGNRLLAGLVRSVEGDKVRVQCDVDAPSTETIVPLSLVRVIE